MLVKIGGIGGSTGIAVASTAFYLTNSTNPVGWEIITTTVELSALIGSSAGILGARSVASDRSKLEIKDKELERAIKHFRDEAEKNKLIREAKINQNNLIDALGRNIHNNSLEIQELDAFYKGGQKNHYWVPKMKH